MIAQTSTGSFRRWVRRLIWLALGLAILACIAIGLVWLHLENIVAEGKKQLAVAITEASAVDPRWRWEEIQEDLQPIPDEENSLHVMSQVADSLQGWNPALLALPEGGYVLEDWPPNRKLDEQRLSIISDAMKDREASMRLAISLKDFSRGRAIIKLTPDFINTELKHADNCRDILYYLDLHMELILNDRDQKKQSI
jgi:hypothetical protein